MFFNYADNSKHTTANNTNQNLIEQSKTKRRTRIPFTKEEDQQILQLVQYFGVNDKNNWYFIASHIKGRTPRQCRERYQLFLCDDVRKKAKWTKDEDDLLISKYKIFGPHWKQMEQFFNGRTSYNIKNRFISLNRRFKFANENQSAFNYDSCASTPTETIENTQIDNSKTDKLELNINNESSIIHEPDEHKDTSTSIFNDSDFDFDDFFPLFDGHENYTLFD